MQVLKRLLAASGATALLVSAGVASPVFAAQPFSATIEMECANSGDTQTVTVRSAQNVLVHIEVTVDRSSYSGGTQRATGLTDGSGTFTDQWTIGQAASATTATVRIWAFTSDGVATGSRNFSIQPANQPCASPNTISFSGSLIDTTQTGGTVAKSCDAGLTGNAVFSATIFVNVGESNLSTTLTLPSGLSLTLACNGEAKALPVLPENSTITLHESAAPAGAVAAADTRITVGRTAALTTIHNAKAAVATASPTPAATPTPTPRTAVLAPTGSSSGTPMLPLVATGLIGLLAVLAGATLVLRRKS